MINENVKRQEGESAEFEKTLFSAKQGIRGKSILITGKDKIRCSKLSKLRDHFEAEMA